MATRRRTRRAGILTMLERESISRGFAYGWVMGPVAIPTSRPCTFEISDDDLADNRAGSRDNKFGGWAGNYTDGILDDSPVRRNGNVCFDVLRLTAVSVLTWRRKSAYIQWLPVTARHLHVVIGEIGCDDGLVVWRHFLKHRAFAAIAQGVHEKQDMPAHMQALFADLRRQFPGIT